MLPGKCRPFCLDLNVLMEVALIDGPHQLNNLPYLMLVTNYLALGY